MRHYALPALAVLMAVYCLNDGSVTAMFGWLAVGVLETLHQPLEPVMMSDPTCAFALHDPASWRLECAYIEKLADLPIRNLAAFILYCEGQRDLAAERGFSDARVRIQRTVIGLQRDRDMRNPPTHIVALVNGRVQVIVKAGERTLRIHLFAQVEDAEDFARKSEKRDMRARSTVNQRYGAEP